MEQAKTRHTGWIEPLSARDHTLRTGKTELTMKFYTYIRNHHKVVGVILVYQQQVGKEFFCLIYLFFVVVVFFHHHSFQSSKLGI